MQEAMAPDKVANDTTNSTFLNKSLLTEGNIFCFMTYYCYIVIS